MKIEISSSLTIRCDRDRVYSYLLDAENEVEWIEPIVRSEKTSAGEISEDTIFRQEAIDPRGTRFETDIIVDRLKFSELIVFKSWMSEYSFTSSYRLSLSKYGTKVEKSFEVKKNRISNSYSELSNSLISSAEIFKLAKCA